MEIPVELAVKIVKDMKEIIKQDLNFINTQGIIIASTDTSRVGSKHEASLKCVKTNNVVVINNDDEYFGSKKGINIPVHFEKEIVGVIGITGKRQEVEKYGNIIKLMTEILIKEAWLNEMYMKKREHNRNIIESLIFGEYKSVEFYTSFKNRYYVIVANSVSKFVVDETFYKIIESYITFDKNNLFALTSNEIIILFDKKNKKVLEETLELMQVKMKEALKLDFKFGIGRLVENRLEDFKLSYVEAKNTLQYLLNFESDKSIMSYSQMDLGILFSNLDKSKISEYTKKVFSNLSAKEIDNFYNIFMIYKKRNGSIEKAAEDLFVHKNTLQYQLNKIEKLTGYNPRKLKDFSILDIAFKLIKLNEK